MAILLNLVKHCRKYHICREKMQLSRAKPGNPASIYIGECVSVCVCDSSRNGNGLNTKFARLT